MKHNFEKHAIIAPFSHRVSIKFDYFSDIDFRIDLFIDFGCKLVAKMIPKSMSFLLKIDFGSSRDRQGPIETPGVSCCTLVGLMIKNWCRPADGSQFSHGGGYGLDFPSRWGTTGGLPAKPSQPVDPGGVGGFSTKNRKRASKKASKNSPPGRRQPVRRVELRARTVSCMHPT